MALYEARIFGPPGTGKTTFLSRQIANAVQAHGPRDVMVTSFTKAAAVELAGRDLPVDWDMVGTLHALCYRALGSPPIAETKVEEWNKEAPSWAQLTATGADVDEITGDVVGGASGDDTFKALERLRAQMVPREMWPWEARSFAGAWDAWKQSIGAIDFTDMVEMAYRDLDTAPGDPRVGFVDEAQDLSRLELSLIRKWGAHMDRLVIAGDDDQAIYHFRGATPDAFLDPAVPDDQKRILTQSYRLPQAIQAYAQTWIEQLGRREPKAYQARDAEGEVQRSGHRYGYPEPLVEEALAHLARGKSVMFLASCKDMLKPLIAVLRREGIPFHNPYRRKNGGWNPLWRGRRGISSSERLLSYLRPAPAAWGSDARMWSPLDTKKWGEILQADGIIRHGQKKNLAALMADDREIEPAELKALFEEQALEQLADLDPVWWAEQIIASKNQSMRFPLAVFNRYGASGLRDEPRLTVGTIHSVKGGEADVVYVWPDLSVPGAQEWMSTGPAHDAIVRQMYVGMTRSRETLVLCSPNSFRAVWWQ